MTFKYNKVYINDTTTVTGPYEKKGPLGKYYDKSFNDLYFGTKTWEDAESFLIEESVNMLFEKIHKNKNEVDLFISGDLMNQLTSSNYAASKIGLPYLGIYSACATSMQGLMLAANMIETNQIKNAICSVSSHNNAAEKQFRYPIEYGGPKPKTTTFTTTGSASAYLSSEKSAIKIDCATVGTVVDLGVKDVYNMGAVMAPAFAKVLDDHLKDTNRKVDYYDMIYSGDLGIYGKKILREYLSKEYNIDLKHYDDTATMIYNVDKQPVYAGGSGPACMPLVAYSYILPKMKKQELKKVLLIATGALMSTTMVNEKHTIPAIAHAISLEVNL